MQSHRWLWAVLLVISILSANGCVDAVASGEAQRAVFIQDGDPSLSQTSVTSALGYAEAEPLRPGTIEHDGVWVTLSAAQSTTSFNDSASQHTEFGLPMLILNRQREPSAVADRTLEITIAGLTGPAEIQVEITSRHVNVATSNRHREARIFLLPDRPCTSGDPCTLQWMFDPSVVLSDLYSLRINDVTGNTLWRNPNSDRPDFVGLDTWDIALDGFTARIYYARLFPFARGFEDMKNRLAPEAVTDFIEWQFVPLVQGTWHMQVHEWGFGGSFHPDWDRDRVIEIICTAPPIALFGGTGPYTIFHDADGRLYPERRIWWPSNSPAFEGYDSLENAYNVVFAHEFFHLLQWNVVLGAGWAMNERPADSGLKLFIEPQGRLAPTVQYPELALGGHPTVSGKSAYARAANRFLTLRLNSPFGETEADGTSKYDAALYWRFLYERYGDMDIIRTSLEEMTVHYDRDSIETFARTMDAAFARVPGPFRTFEESVTAFAAANYALRLENGRCTSPDIKGCARLHYDPNGMYAEPPLEAQLQMDGARLSYSGNVPGSFGTDYVEVTIASQAQVQPLAIRFDNEGSQHTRFDVQIWILGPGEEKPRMITPHLATAVQEVREGNTRFYTIAQTDTVAKGRLALIITRLDSFEKEDQFGAYRITLEPGQYSIDGGA
jgi:hypothetical protein